MLELLPLIIGSLGMLLILTAFVLNQLHKLSEDSALYDLINVLGSGLLVAYALAIEGYPFAILNGVWFLVSFYDLWTDLRER